MASGSVLDDQITPALERVERGAPVAIAGMAAARSVVAEEYMQANAPWQDRTGEARSGLTAQLEVSGSEVAIVLAHTVAYGIYLETQRSGQDEIIRPTVDLMGDELMKDAAGLFGQLLGRGATT